MADIQGVLSYRWKQKGSRPIVLTVYDAMIADRWHATIENAVSLWANALPFDLVYQRLLPDAPAPSATQRIYIYERATLSRGFCSPDHTNVIDWYNIVLDSGTGYEIDPATGQLILRSDAEWWTQRVARHEIGHGLSLDHHLYPGPWGGGAEPDCCLANGNQVTQYDLGLLCQAYRC